jgi:hypothetical protein
MYVRPGNPGTRGVARKNSLSGVRRGFGVTANPARMDRVLRTRLRGLGYGYDSSGEPFQPVLTPSSGGSYNDLFGNSFPSNPTALSPTGGGISAGGGLTPSSAALLSQAINTAGVVAKSAVTPTPMVTYNPLTGQYEATGGAALPSGLMTSTALTSYLPLLLLGGGLLLVVVMAKR